MKFALDTYREVFNGSKGRDQRIRAMFAFAMWFIAGAFIISTAMFYITPHESQMAAVVGGAIVSAVVAAIKFA